MFLIDDLLRSLIAMKGQATTCALHYDSRTESAQH
jgi:hypothetical protein